MPAKHVAYLHGGDIVTLTGWAPTGWGKVVTSGGASGYVSPKYLVKCEEMRTTGKLWLRSGAGTNNSGLIVIPLGEKVPILGSAVFIGATPWFPTEYKGYTGYASGKYISIT